MAARSSIRAPLGALSGRMWNAVHGHLVVAMAFIAPTATATLVASWMDCGNMTTGRDNFALAHLGSRLYAVGGGHGNSSTLATSEALDFPNGTWSPIAARLSTPRESHGLAALGGELYVAGGWDGSSPIVSLRSVEVYNPARPASWREALPMRHARNGLGLVGLGAALYAVGGIDETGRATSSMEIYEPTALEPGWRSGASMRAARSFFGLTAASGKLYAAGGYDMTGAPTASAEEYDPLARSWSDLAPMATARGGLGLTAITI